MMSKYPRVGLNPGNGPDYEPHPFASSTERQPQKPEAPEMTMRERLARAATAESYRDIFRYQSELERSVEKEWPRNLSIVDAIIRELMEPSSTTKALMSDEFWENYREVMQHILDESRT